MTFVSMIAHLSIFSSSRPRLLRNKDGGGNSRNDHLNLCPVAGIAIEREPAAQLIGYNVVDDVQP